MVRVIVMMIPSSDLTVCFDRMLHCLREGGPLLLRHDWAGTSLTLPKYQNR